MRRLVTAGLALLLVVCCSQVEAAGKTGRAKQQRGRRGAEPSGQNDIWMPPVCGAKVRKKPSNCQQGCTTQVCDCCIGAGGGVGIDVDSLTDKAQSKKLYEAYQARIKFELPEDASIELYDQPMTTPGKKRAFVVPVYKQDKMYDYHFTVSVVRDGKKYFKKHKVENFQAGMILAVKVAAPEEVPDGELPIKIEAKPVMKGGKPKEDKGSKKVDDQGIKVGSDKDATGTDSGAGEEEAGISAGTTPKLPPVDPKQ